VKLDPLDLAIQNPGAQARATVKMTLSTGREVVFDGPADITDDELAEAARNVPGIRSVFRQALGAQIVTVRGPLPKLGN
jgi:hypothetical protein